MTWTDGTVTKLAPVAVGRGVIGAPRLLGPWAPFGPVVSSTGLRWAHTLSVSDALSTWTLMMRNARNGVVRSWTGSAADGQIRGVAWNGRTAAGRAVPLGVYHWTLTGSGPYGGPVGALGSGAAMGLVRVIAQVPSAVKITAPVKVKVNTIATLGGTLVKAGTNAGLAGPVLTFWRKLGTGPWVRLASATTNRTGRVGLRVKMTRTALFQIRMSAVPAVRGSVSRVVGVKV